MTNAERPPRRGVRRLAAAVAVALAAATVGVITSTPAWAAGATIQIDTTGNIGDGQTIQVSGNAGGPNAPALYVAVCQATPTASNCDQSLSGFGTATAHIQQVTPDASTGAWSANFYVRTTIITGDTSAPGFDCIANQTCVIGTTDSVNPAIHTYDATTLLSPRLGPAITVTPTSGLSGSTVSVSGTGFPTTNTTTGAAITQSVNIGLCGYPPTSTSCDGNLADYASATVANGQLPATNVTLHFPFTDFGGAPHTCQAANSCIVGTSNATNQADQTFTAAAPIQNSQLPATLTVGSVTGQSVTTAARAGDVINLTGTSWNPTGAITAQLCDPSGANCDATGLTGSTLATDSSGNLTGGVTVDPSATTGARTVLVSQGSQIASANITILAAPTLGVSPASGGAGTSVSVSGSNWNPGSTVTIQGTNGTTATGDAPVTVTAGTSGSISGTYTVKDPATTTITATAGALSASQAFAFSGDQCTVPTSGSCSVQQNVTFTAIPGQLSQSQSGGTVNLGSLQLDGTQHTLTGAINEDTITDARGTSAGWTLNASLTDLTNGSTPTANGTIPAADMAWVPTCKATSGGGTLTVGSSTALSNLDQLFCSVGSGTGNGVYTADSSLTLTVPATADAGTYNAILMLTLS